MTSPRTDPRLARDVARHLDRRRMRRRLLVWTSLLAAVVAAAMYLTCGHGFGLGGAGPGSGEGPGPGSVKARAGKTRCALRVSASGITVDDKPMLRDEAAAACKARGGADVVITGDARQGDRNDLLDALMTAGVTDIFVQPPPPP